MKEKIYPTLMTEISEAMDRECPWNVYPRPQLKRDSFICLNGLWDFCITKNSMPPEQYSKKILVPFPIESELSGIKRELEKHDTAYYRRTFTLPEGFVKDKLLLRFGAIDRFARVSVNGKVMGIHNCGYTPFYADITKVIREGENEVVVEVRDDLDPTYPYGKQKRARGGMWYTPVSGIWQTVWLESVPENYIENLRITPTLDSVKIECIGAVGKKKLTIVESGEIFEFEDSEITVEPKNITHGTP